MLTKPQCTVILASVWTLHIFCVVHYQFTVGIYFVLYFHTYFTYTIATGHDENEDALLGYPQDTSTTNDNKAVFLEVILLLD